MLHCANCKLIQDLDEAPDTGECSACRGPLVENESEQQAVEAGTGFHAIVGAVGDGLAACALARRRAGKGSQ